MIKAIQGYFSGRRSHFIKKDGIRILYYHGVVENKTDGLLERNLHVLGDFKAHLCFLRRFKILSLGELAEELAAPRLCQNPAAVITFDDGYANNRLVAEILGDFHLPWSLFISTAAVGGESVIWSVELSLLILHGQAEEIEVFDKVWSLHTCEQREIAFQAIRYPVKALPSLLREQVIAEIREQFPKEETKRLLSQFPSLRMLSWDEIKQLAHSGVEIGSHGVKHEIHHLRQPENIRRYELMNSKAALERRLQAPCCFFSFPNGDFISSSAQEAQEAGYHLAFTTQPTGVTLGANPFLLPRLDATKCFKHSLK